MDDGDCLAYAGYVKLCKRPEPICRCATFWFQLRPRLGDAFRLRTTRAEPCNIDHANGHDGLSLAVQQVA
jgi:hypothetical protein